MRNQWKTVAVYVATVGMLTTQACHQRGHERDGTRGANDLPEGGGGPREVPADEGGAGGLAGATSTAEGGGDGGGGANHNTLARTWALWPMPNAASSGLPNAASYNTSTPGVVVDNITHLMWQRALPVARSSWDGAKKACDTLTLGDYTDWRLPTRIELTSIVDIGSYNPAIDVTAFPQPVPDDALWTWTSSTHSDNAELAWVVDFGEGGVGDTLNPLNWYRCVRGGSPENSDDHYDIDSGTVTDLRTGLVWEQNPDVAVYAFVDGAAHCADLSLAGRDDWRVPSVKELQTVVDESRRSPTIDTSAFPDTASDVFWTSSPIELYTAAWFVDFDSGWVYYHDGDFMYHDLENEYRVRCVR